MLNSEMLCFKKPVCPLTAYVTFLQLILEYCTYVCSQVFIVVGYLIHYGVSPGQFRLDTCLSILGHCWQYEGHNVRISLLLQKKLKTLQVEKANIPRKEKATGFIAV